MRMHVALFAMVATLLAAPKALRAQAGQTEPASAAVPPAPLSARARQILRSRPYSFCHNERRVPRPADLVYCGYVDAQSACPEFARACEALARTRTPSCAARNDGAGAATARMAYLVVIVAITTLLAVAFVRALLRARRAEALVDVAPAPEPQRPSALPLRVASAGEIYARALDAYARGDFRAALYGLYAALLRRLDERGEVRLDPAFTAGDYVRQCGPPELRAPLRDVTREVERVRFGGAQATADAFERLRARIEPIVRGLGALVAALALGGALAACDEGGLGVGSVETGPAGHRAVRELLHHEGVRVLRLAEAPEDVTDVSRVLLIDGEAITLEDRQWTALLAWVGRGGHLVLAGGASRWPAALGVHQTFGPGRSTEFVFVEAFGGLRVRVRPGTPTLGRPLPGYAVANSPEDDATYGALVILGQGQVLLLAGNELVTNGGIAVADNASASVSVIRSFARDRDVYFIEDPEAGSNNPIRVLVRAGLLPAVLQGLLVLTLFFVMMGRHFATPRDRTVERRRAFAEHVRALGGLYARAGASGAVLRSYAQLALDRLRERTAGSHASLSEAVAARVGEPREEVERVLAEAERAHTGAGTSAGEAQDLKLVKRLNDWLMKLSQ